MTDRLLILPDEDRDGVADEAIEFCRVHNPTGFEFWNGGVIVASAPDLWFFKDTDGDDRADIQQRILHGLDSADTHHAANNLTLGPDGAIYYQRGVFHVSNVGTPWRKAQEHRQSSMFRLDPRTFEFGFHANNSPNPHGVSFDRYGGHFATDGTGGRAYQVRPRDDGEGFTMRKLLDHSVRPVSSSAILSSAHFPEAYQNGFLICNTIGYLGIKRYALRYNEDGVATGGQEVDMLWSTKDRNFRPTDTEVGDDGALYVSDWQNILIGHMQHNVRDPSRDHEFGRVYRITAKGRPLLPKRDLTAMAIPDLLDLLLAPTGKVRQRCWAELTSRDADEVMAALDVWLAPLDPDDPKHAEAFLEGLWLRQRCGVEDYGLLSRVLASPNARVRDAGRIVRQHWNRDPRDANAAAEAAANAEPSEAPAVRTSEAKLRARGFSDEHLALYELGADVFLREGHCATCHQRDGRGLPKIYPTLHETRWVEGDEERLIKLTLKGLWGKITVGNTTFNEKTRTTPPMTGFASLLDDYELAGVLTYVRNTFGNKASPVVAKTVERVRQATADQTQFYIADDLLKQHPMRAAPPEAKLYEQIDPEPGTAPRGRVVFVTGDEEYRSEESMPAIAEILAKRHGYSCRVLFAIDPETNAIDPNTTDNIPGLEALDSADLLVLFTRFRNLPDAQMQHIVDYVESGRPVVALRTSTHAFRPEKGRAFHNYRWGGRSSQGGFGRQVLGERWVSHHGQHGSQSTRGVPAASREGHPILRGIPPGAVWDPADVYTVRLPMLDGIEPILLGDVLDGMNPDSPPVAGPKNNPRMPIAWTRSWTGASGKPARIFATTIGASQAFLHEGSRRLLINACYWALGREDDIRADASVDLVSPYTPSAFGFNKAKRGVRPRQRL